MTKDPDHLRLGVGVQEEEDVMAAIQTKAGFATMFMTLTIVVSTAGVVCAATVEAHRKILDC